MVSGAASPRSYAGLWLVVAFACFVQGCGVDARRLSRKRADVGTQPDAQVFGDSGIFVSDSGNVSYDEDSGRSASREAGTKPPPEVCLHFVDGAADCDKTLALNSDFNTDIEGWAASGFAQLRWVAKDVENAKGSGSLGVKNATTGNLDGLGEVAGTQCFEITPGRVYDYEASVFIKHGQVDYGVAQLGVWFFEGTHCQGLVQTDGAYTIQGVQATDSWIPIAGSLAPLEVSKSMLVRLIAQKPFQSGPFEVLFDAVRITSRPSVQP